MIDHTLIRLKTELKDELKAELIHNILPYWMNHMVDRAQGGFYGQITGREELIDTADKGGILNARILWTFSASYGYLKDPAYLTMANRARDYILNYFVDKDFGGTYWSLSYQGNPAETKKQIYSMAFFIYALVEYYKVTGDRECLSNAIALFKIIENHSFDKINNGYFEAFSRDWKMLDDLRLSEKDANEKKTMNTHLHVLEAYTNLFRVWKDETLSKQLKNLIIIFLDKILDPGTNHLKLFFDEEWHSKSTNISYGHDIEASWLIYEAVLVLGDTNLFELAENKVIRLADAAAEGVQKDGSMIYERDSITGHPDTNRHWWVQAETIVGYLNAFNLTNQKKYLLIASECWHYIKQRLIDKEHGEWYWSADEEGFINKTGDKAGFWKCPYHNARSCMEVMNRFAHMK